MSVDVRTSVVIERPRGVVAAYATDPANAPEWYANIRSVRWLTQPPVEVGSQFAFVAQFLGRTLAYTYEVRQLVPGELFVMSTAEGPFPMRTTYLWEDVPGGATRMVLRNSGEPSGFSRMAAPAMSAAMRRANTKDLQAIKTLLEAQR